MSKSPEQGAEQSPPTSRYAEFDRLWSSYWLDVQAVGPLTATRFRLILREMEREVRRHGVEPNRIVDVGCGSGRLLGLLAIRFPRAEWMGIEPSATARAGLPEWMRERVLAGGLRDVEPQWPEGGADLIVCSEVLEHVDAPAEELAALMRLAAPGALLILTVPAGMRHWSVQDDEAGHRRRFEVDEFTELIRNAGARALRLFTWGGPVAWLYNRALNRLGPRRAAQTGRSTLGRLAARIVSASLRIDDLFVGLRGFQLIATVRRAP